MLQVYNHSFGLGQLSESALEASHKFLRKYRKTLSRGNDLKSNLLDVLTRLFLKSSPLLRSQKPKVNKRKKGDDSTVDDQLVASFFLGDVELDE